MSYSHSNPHPVNEGRKRRLYRLAQLIHDLWKKARAWIRAFSSIPTFTTAMRSKDRQATLLSYHEHLVPCVYLRDECTERFRQGWTVERVAEFLDKYLWIAKIEKPAQVALVNEKYKTSMPDGWNFESGDVCARLTAVGLALQKMT
jgi:hypothetical protein